MAYYFRWAECEYCGKGFSARNNKHKFCSRECHTLFLDRQRARSRFIIFNRDGFRCIYCGKSSFGDSVALEIDHIVPFSSGGKNTASNLATACHDCNTEKLSGRLNNEKEILDEIARRNSVSGINPDKKIKLPRR